ncbi:Transposon Tf2-11 polyprotein [Vitis vinifera]|uniref:Transposon Tf2-11 polyprotein n=1 Tax=Vitis vinifera TaxID=29760 RepID=A0A438HT99_VITVI|nr:Transposon Tf2-11 polyprotein [Vitis vinifera]
MKLNPSKCAFGVSAGKFLGFMVMVSQRGIEVSSDQVKAVMETPPPTSKKELQRLTGKLVELGRFIARFTDELRPFFLAIRKAGTTGWTNSCQSAFEKIKHYLTQPPILSNPSLEKNCICIWLNKVLKDRANGFSPSKCRLETPSLLPNPPGGHTDRLAPSQHPAQAGLDRKNASMGHRVEREEYEAKDERMARYLTKVRDTLQRFAEWTIEKIPRTDNVRVDALAGIAASLPIKEAILLPIHVQSDPSITEASTCNTIEASQGDGQEWTEVITRYLQTGTLLEEPRQAHKIRVQAARRSLAHRAHPQGYYWPTMKKDVAAYVKRCDKCQRHAPIPHVSSETLKPISSPWPFAQWGMDIVGPLPAAAAHKKFLLVATDYFSKWVEAEAYASIKDKDITKFMWKNIICRFGIPQTILANNDPQFDSITFRNFCSELNIRNLYSIPCYPQSNGQAEATNKTLVTALKKRLEQAKGKWVEELPGVLWAYRTTPRRPTGNTPFALAYGMDAVIPTKIGLPTI